MKTRRFLSVFSFFNLNRPQPARHRGPGAGPTAVLLLAALLCSLLLSPMALAEEAAKQIPDPAVDARAALLVDEKTGAVLYAKNEHEELYPASLTKIMTCLLVLRAVAEGKLSLDQQITAPAEAFRNLDKDGSTANIKVGETLSVENLLYCLMVVSANEAANILAVTVGGDVDTFVDSMNAEAEKLGCKNTHFANAIGLQDSRHYTSAWDLYLITKEAMTHKAFMTICDTADIVIPATNLSAERHLYTTNYLLSNWRAHGYKYANAHGVKTGSTSDAGHCLVSTASKNGKAFISVVLGAQRIVGSNGVANVKSFSETSRLFEWGFSNFSYQTVLTANDMLASMPVTLSKKADSVALHPTEDVEILMPSALQPEDLARTIRFEKKSAEAPVKKGEKLAEVTLSYDGTVYATVPLVSVAEVLPSRSLLILHQVRIFFEKPLVRVLGVVLLLLIAALVIWKITVGRRRYRYGKSVRPQRGYHGRRRPF
ncbi:MAG: D-alanyl-D-alanine carboxypeptidase [Oscillibacter sp.]|nr:D-alanyl-D-alanine carboxypeptidase [Oscillibacter sp.]